ncbi:unnamed protein product [Pylaiella littoralis]
MDPEHHEEHLTRYFSPSSCLVRRSTRRVTSTFNPGSRGVYRRHGLVAMLLVADRSRVVDAFGGVAVGVASTFRIGSTGIGSATPPAEGTSTSRAVEELRRGGRGEGRSRRMMVRPRSTTLAPATSAGEEQALSGEPKGPNGSAAGEDAASKTATLDRDQKDAETGRGTVEAPQRGKPKRLGAVIHRAGRDKRRNEGRTIRKSQSSTSVVGFEELNSFRVDPSLVRPSIVRYLANAEQLSSMQFANLGMASSRHCDIHLTMEVCEKARSMGVRTNVYFMTKLVDAAAKSRRWVTAVQLLQLMRSYGVLPNAVTYTCILAQMSKAKQHHMAAEMVQTEGLQNSLFAYNALISGCTSSRGYDRAMGYFNDMTKQGVKPDDTTFSSLIATTRDGSEQSPERGLAVLQMMRDAGLKPSTICINSLMAVNVQARQPGTALEIFKEMEKDGVPRDLVSYNTAIAACDKLGDAEAAVRLLRQAREDDIVPDIFSYNSAISALCHNSLWQEATKIFEEMHEAGVTPALVTYNTLISGCVRAGAPIEAMSVFSLMKQKRVKRDQYSFAGGLWASVQLRDHELAMDLLEEMVDMGMPANVEGYATAIRTCARCSKGDEAVYVYADQLRMAVVPTKATYKALIEAFAHCKDAERAVWVLDEMREMQVPIEHWHLMDVMYACTDESHIALEVLRVNEELDLKTAAKMYATALEVCIAAGDFEAAMTAMEMMYHMDLEPEPEQEKRMLQSCADPLWVAKEERARGREEGQEEAGDRKGDGGVDGSDFWREKDTADRLAEEEDMR